MNNFDWNLVRSFLAVARSGSLSRAVRATGISQPTLGRHIGELEAGLQVTLFERQRRGMVLTDTGRELLERAEGLEREAAAFSLAATGRSSEIAGTIRISASEIVAHYVLPGIIAELKREEPALEIEIVSSNEVQNLLIRDADIAVRMVEPTQGELIARKVNELSIGCYAATAYLERAGRPSTTNDLFNHSIVGYDRNDLLIKSIRALGYQIDRHAFAVRTDAQVAHWKLVEAGAGVGFVANAIASGRPGIERILHELPTGSIPMWLAAHRELRTSRRVRRVYDFLADHLADLPLSA